MRPIEVLIPANLAELRAALTASTAATHLLAGGTDLMLELHGDGDWPDCLIDLSGMRELSYVRKEHRWIRVGATTTFASLCGNATLAAHAPCLARAAAEIGSLQIRNVATIGGNVANASPCADALTALLALRARATVLTGRGQPEQRPLSALLSPTGGTALLPGEAIVEFSFLPLTAHQRTAFAKIGARSTVSAAKLNAAVVMTLDESGETIIEATVAFGALAPTAFVDPIAAAALRGAAVHRDTAERFAAACEETVRRAIPSRSSLAYKRGAMAGLALDLWSAMELDRSARTGTPAI